MAYTEHTYVEKAIQVFFLEGKRRALVDLFTWHCTKEGTAYWYDEYNSTEQIPESLRNRVSEILDSSKYSALFRSIVREPLTDEEIWE